MWKSREAERFEGQVKSRILCLGAERGTEHDERLRIVRRFVLVRKHEVSMKVLFLLKRMED